MAVPGTDVTRPYEPIFNVPVAVMGIIALCVLVWAGDVLLLSDDEEIEFLLYFAFIPARYGGSPLVSESISGRRRGANLDLRHLRVHSR